MNAIESNQDLIPLSINMIEESVTLSENAPLKSLKVFVDVTLNAEDYSPIYKKFLLELGAEVENNLNKKCNLMIWKDGNIKNYHKAQENKIEVISPGWLDECLDHRTFRNFSNYRVKLKEENLDEPSFTWLNKNKGKKKQGFFSAKFLDQDINNQTNEKKTKSQNQKDNNFKKDQALFDPKKYKAITEYFQTKIKQAVKNCFDYSILENMNDEAEKENIIPDPFKSTKKINIGTMTPFNIKKSSAKKGAVLLTSKGPQTEAIQDLKHFGFKKESQFPFKQEIKIEENNNIWIDLYDPKNKISKEQLELFSKKNIKIVENNAKHFRKIVLMLKFEDQIPNNFKLAYCIINDIPIIPHDKINIEVDFKFAKPPESNIKPFKNMRFFISPEDQIFKSTFPSNNEILELLIKAGANIVENVRAADYCIVKKSVSKKFIKTVPIHVKSINMQWIYDCIIENRLQNIENPIYKIL